MLSELQKRKLTALFNAHDKDGNGLLEKGDWEAFAKSVCEGLGLALDSPDGKEAYAQTMAGWGAAAAGRGDDAKISLDEFVGSYAITIGNKELYDRLVAGYGDFLFGLWDTDGDDKLAYDEWVRLTACYGVGEEAAQDSARRLDDDGDGYLTTQELLQAIDEFFGDDPDAPGNWLFGPY
jgi:Ca2+-binding EF-hand superfamily protein